MMKYILILISFFIFIGPARAATLADLQAAIMQEDYKKANDIAHELQAAKLTREENVESRYYLGISSLRLGEYVRAEQTF